MRDDGIVEQLRGAETILQDYKVRQKIAGDSWTVYRYASPGSGYDIYLTGLTTSANFVRRWKLTYQIEGGRTIPNAFAIFYVDYDNETTLVDPYGNIYTMTTGIDYNDEDAGDDPLSLYIVLTAAYNWNATANTFIGVKFRAISPYKGKIIYEEVF